MHQDYILRMIQQMTSFITRVLHLHEEGESEQALAELTHAYGRMSGLPASLVHGLSEDNLITLLTTQGRLNADKSLALAELLREEGHIYEDLDQFGEAYPRYLKALRLYLESLVEEEDLRAADFPGLDDVITRLEGYDLTAGVRGRLLPYLEVSGQFDRAENVLVHWVEHDPNAASITNTESFYRRLLTKTDAELIVGGLTRDEVREGLEWIEGLQRNGGISSAT
jgi:tetratricopeptide (TPR) repeat protein